MDRKNIWILRIFMLIIIFINYTSIIYSNDMSSQNTIDILINENRFFDENGSFSYLIPIGWYSTNIPGTNYSSIIGPSNGNTTPVVMFSIDSFVGTVNELVDRLIDGLINMHGNNFELLQRIVFLTQEGLIGEKFITTTTVSGHQIRQVNYCFIGNNNLSLVISCVVNNEVTSYFDIIFDKIAETFIWEEANNLLDKANLINRFTEESIGFQFVPPDPWQEYNFDNLNYKGILVEQRNFINFDLVNFDNNLLSFVNNYIEILILRFQTIEDSNILIVDRSILETKNNLIFERIITDIIRVRQNTLRQVVYFIPREDNMLLLIFCSINADSSLNYLDRLDDAIMTFEWLR